MRFYVKDSERKPDPAPARVNARLAILVGIGLWLLALAWMLVFAGATTAHKPWYPFTCLAGVGLGIFAWFKVGRR